MNARTKIVPLIVLAAVACGKPKKSTSDGAINGNGTGVTTTPTYYKDVKPLIDAKCALCHTTGGIAPFTLQNFADVSAHASVIKPAVQNRVMPPWLAGPGCSDYKGDRSLTELEIATLASWVDAGAPAGDATHPGAALGASAPGLSRADLRIAMTAAYTPQTRPDEYRCFVLDWPATATKFVTGFRVNPGTASIVHHVIAFVGGPSSAAEYQSRDHADGRPGYACFGSPGSQPNWIGSWAPGGTGFDFPAGTGIKVEPGSKIIVQVHYNTLNIDPAPDLTSLDLKLDDSVAKEAVALFWADPDWVGNKTMSIPSGDADVVHSFSIDPTPYMGYLTQGVVPTGSDFTIYLSTLHMHTRGSRARLEIERAAGSNECVLEIPHWDFHWQSGYEFETPKIFHPGDKLKLECHWDNSAGHQPIVNGKPLTPPDLNWGENTTDEMCLGVMYVTK